MDKLYLIGCFVIALLLPHLSHDNMSTTAQILAQGLFVFIGIAGFNTFKD